MNDHRPYDQSLRDKLTKLPVPDVNKHWPAMRKLLDEEMPEGGGYSKRRGGWWMFSALLIFIIAGSWSILTMNFSKQNVDPPLSASQTSPPDQKAKQGLIIQPEKPVAADDKILLSKKLRPDQKATEYPTVQPSSSPDVQKAARLPLWPIAGEEAAKSSVPADGPKIKDGKGPSISGSTSRDSTLTNSTSTGSTLTGSKSAGATSIESPPTGSPLVVSPVNKLNDRELNKETTAKNNKAGGTINNTSTEGNNVPVAAAVAPANDVAIEASEAISVQRLPLASFAADFDSIEPEPWKVVKYAPVSRKYYRQHKKYGKPVNIREPYTTVGRNFAVGLSLPLAFPLGDQKALGYNVNAGPNTATDYIPAPHVQYHLNGKAYLQSELQLMSPQFIRPVLLYQHQYANSTSSTTNSIYARKLYYFNVPVSLHYSPFKHFYMGTGLQFSSLLSGVAMHEQQRSGMVPGDSIYNVRYAKFSNDSISNKLNSSEMRLMLDANYYWNRFTVGLRYNQALSNYVSTRVAANMPYTLDKNKSLQFYMRYNLWEDKKRKTASPRIASLR